MMTSGTSESANSTDISESIDDYVTEKVGQEVRFIRQAAGVRLEMFQKAVCSSHQC